MGGRPDLRQSVFIDSKLSSRDQARRLISYFTRPPVFLHLIQFYFHFVRLVHAMLKVTNKPLLVGGLFVVASLWAMINYGPESLLLRRVFMFQLVKYALVYVVVNICLGKPLLLRFALAISFAFAVYDCLSWSHALQEIPAVRGRFFIAGNLYNSENVLPYYTRELDRFIHHVGESNVFVSIVEDHSEDQTPHLLQNWASRLDRAGVSNQILTSFPVPKKEGLNRIERLAFLRNAALQPFFDPKSGFASNIRPGDRIIFINDIFFFMEDILILADVAKEKDTAACSVDFGQYGLYDTWVLRDVRGRSVEHIYPHFISPNDQELWSEKRPVPVFSCWNGAVVMDAQLLKYFTNHLLAHQPFKTIPTFKTTHPSLPNLPSPTAGLQFRASSKDECYSSECFLLWLDLRQVDRNISLYMHPKAIVTYSLTSFLAWKEFHAWEIIKYATARLLRHRVILHKPSPHKDQHIYDC